MGLFGKRKSPEIVEVPVRVTNHHTCRAGYSDGYDKGYDKGLDRAEHEADALHRERKRVAKERKKLSKMTHFIADKLATTGLQRPQVAQQPQLAAPQAQAWLPAPPMCTPSQMAQMAQMAGPPQGMFADQAAWPEQQQFGGRAPSMGMGGVQPMTPSMAGQARPPSMGMAGPGRAPSIGVGGGPARPPSMGMAGQARAPSMGMARQARPPSMGMAGPARAPSMGMAGQPRAPSIAAGPDNPGMNQGMANAGGRISARDQFNAMRASRQDRGPPVAHAWGAPSRGSAPYLAPPPGGVTASGHSLRPHSTAGHGHARPYVSTRGGPPRGGSQRSRTSASPLSHGPGMPRAPPSMGHASTMSHSTARHSVGGHSRGMRDSPSALDGDRAASVRAVLGLRGHTSSIKDPRRDGFR